MDVSVIILNYNTMQLTLNCISSLYEHTTGIDFEIILVDNASAEPGIDTITEKYPQVELIKSPENLGFSGGNNLGIQHARGRYILLLNSDTYLQENAIYASYLYMEQNSSVGVVSPRLVFPDGRLQSVAQRFPSVKYQLFELFRLQKILGKKISSRFLLGAFFHQDQTVEVDWVWGAFFMFRREIMDKLPNHKLDDEYFMYWEDVQWCMDIKKLGYRIFFFADTEIVHIHSGSKGKKNEMMVNNGIRFFQRNYSWLHRTLYKIIQTSFFRS